MSEVRLLRHCSWAWKNPPKRGGYGETSQAVRFGNYIENQMDVEIWIDYQSHSYQQVRQGNATEFLASFIEAGKA